MKTLIAATISLICVAAPDLARADATAYTVVTGTPIKSADPAALNCNGVSTQTHASGVASCPAGYVATGGSVQCQFPGAGGAQGGGIMLTSRLIQPTSGNGNVFQWLGDCCVGVSTTVNSYDGISIMCVEASKFQH